MPPRKPNPSFNTPHHMPRNPNYPNRPNPMMQRPPQKGPYAPYKFQSNTPPPQHNPNMPNQSFSSQTNRHPQRPNYGRHTNLQRLQPVNNHVHRNKANTVSGGNPRFKKAYSNPLAMQVNTGRPHPNFVKMRSTGKIGDKVN